MRREQGSLRNNKPDRVLADHLPVIPDGVQEVANAVLNDPDIATDTDLLLLHFPNLSHSTIEYGVELAHSLKGTNFLVFEFEQSDVPSINIIVLN